MVYVIDDDESVRKALKRLFRSVDLDMEIVRVILPIAQENDMSENA